MTFEAYEKKKLLEQKTHKTSTYRGAGASYAQMHLCEETQCSWPRSCLVMGVDVGVFLEDTLPVAPPHRPAPPSQPGCRWCDRRDWPRARVSTAESEMLKSCPGPSDQTPNLNLGFLVHRI